MSKLDHRTMRILFDMQACQTLDSTHRGVGRYSRAFFESIYKIRGDIDVTTFANDSLRYPFASNGFGDGRVIRMSGMPSWQSGRIYQNGDAEFLDNVAHSAHSAHAKADVVHVSHVFEGFSGGIGLPSHRFKAPGQIYSATLYDLIPLRFPEFYFQSPDFKKWYLSRLSWLRQADLLFAISESSRQDAINLLGMDGDKIHTVYGGIGDHFCPPADRLATKAAIQKSLGLRGRYILYTGGDDHRKNIKGMIAAFAALNDSLRTEFQLLIVCSVSDERKAMYLAYGRSVGVPSDKIIFSGFVSEADLVSIYQSADLFVFPSLYEGLGLPVLEAMACAAPVIGGANSSVQELIGRADALFDASSSTSIASKIELVLTTPAFEQELRTYGPQQSKKFNWDRAASIAKAAIVEAVQQNQQAGQKLASKGWLPRRRLAMLSPLPADRSGIADYSASFLPFLAKHFDIDLFVVGGQPSDDYINASFRVFNASVFEQVASTYDVILYEFGNSEFHEHMLPLLKKFPGVVSLHDAYLSGLAMYLEYYKGEARRYEKEMLISHGPMANRYFAPVAACDDPVGKSIIELPCTKSVIDQAIGVVSHSPFNLEIARRFFPEGFKAPYRIIPQLVIEPEAISEGHKREIRAHLGLGADDLIVATFGHVAWTKLGDQIFDAFQQAKSSKQRNVVFIYVGELSADEWGANLAVKIRDANLGGQVRVTGFQTDALYRDYLHCTDLAIQLRCNSRGGTPKGVLDCLAYGIPVIVNDDASYRDYPDDVVRKLPATPTLDEISAAFDTLIASKVERDRLAKRGLDFVREVHNPNEVAAAYAAAIHSFTELERVTKPEFILEALAPNVASLARNERSLLDVRSLTEVIPPQLFSRRRVFVDVSYLSGLDSQTGISRVVGKIVQNFYTSDIGGFEPIAFQLKDGAPVVATDWLQRAGIVSATYAELYADFQFDFREGDTVLMLDSSWAIYDQFYPTFAAARSKGAKIYTIVYDILPIRLPPGNIVEGGKEWFTGWIKEAADQSDGLIGISHAEVSNIRDYVETNIKPEKSLKYGFWHLGADFESADPAAKIAPEIKSLLSKPYLLMVGTIEPRKCHELALDAMERLWSHGSDLRLALVGKKGWMVDELWDRMQNHPLRGQKFFLFEGANDRELGLLYESAAALLMLSRGEGFGLPLVEAAKFGTPIVCSDLPVFREIAGDFATYSGKTDPVGLAMDIQDWRKKVTGQKQARVNTMPFLSWAQSADSLLKVVLSNAWLDDGG